MCWIAFVVFETISNQTWSNGHFTLKKIIKYTFQSISNVVCIVLLSTYIYLPLCMIFTILLTLWNSEPKKLLKIKLFCFSSDFDATWWSCSTHCVLQFYQVLSKSDEKQKSFINCLFFCSEFQSVSRIVIIVYCAIGMGQVNFSR